ncbi:peptidoglycan DL-endopeptidase CwlO [Marmoricola sp. URHA0025 HA25]
MHARTRGVLTAAVTVVAVLTVGTSAQADRHKPVPTQAQIDQANAVAAQKAGDVAALQASLAVANSKLHAAADRAEIAAEAYNGAMWRLQQAQKATSDAQASVADALAHVAEQRAGIAQLVTQSYQDDALTGVTAIIGGDDPSTVMSRVGVVQSAGDSMQARFDQYTALNALARVAQDKAEKAEAQQTALAAKAETLRNDAAQAANLAQSEAARIAGERHKLIEELAKAQKISVDLATKRQAALEKKAAEAQAHAAQVAANKAKDQTDKAKQQAELTQDQLAELGVEGGWEDPGLPVPAGTSVGARAAIEFARSQLGEPYVWGAAGPDSWDCSGLTMVAWQKGGIALPHYSAAQYQQTKHIGAADLKAGDLVFWGTSPNTIHHVALYIGNDQIIQAPHTGDVVKVSPLFASAPDFYGRP